MSMFYSIPNLPPSDDIDCLIVPVPVARWLTQRLKDHHTLPSCFLGMPIVLDPLLPADKVVVRGRYGVSEIIHLEQREEP